jgi:hypothetical protein
MRAEPERASVERMLSPPEVKRHSSPCGSVARAFQSSWSAVGTTNLPANSASVALDEAILSANIHKHKKRVAAKALRVLHYGGRNEIHEL